MLLLFQSFWLKRKNLVRNIRSEFAENATKYFVVKGINMLKRLTQIEGSGITLTNNAIKDIKESGP